MKKYKLINNYPSHEIGDIARYMPEVSEELFIWEKPVNPNLKKAGLEFETIPKNFQPNVTIEWFKEIIEDNYRILSFKNNNSIVSLQANGYYTCCRDGNTSDCITCEHMLALPNAPIYSVKDLARNIVFTVGDSFYYDNGIDSKSQNYTLTSFRIVTDNVYGDTVILMHNNLPIAHLPICFPVPKPLFTTEDKVKIYENDTYFFVATFDWRISPNIARQAGCVTVYKMEGIKCFSTKEKAEEYVIENKPLFSIQNLKSICGSEYWSFNEDLIFSAKEKLNLND